MAATNIQCFHTSCVQACGTVFSPTLKNRKEFTLAQDALHIGVCSRQQRNKTFKNGSIPRNRPTTRNRQVTQDKDIPFTQDIFLSLVKASYISVASVAESSKRSMTWTSFALNPSGLHFTPVLQTNLQR